MNAREFWKMVHNPAALNAFIAERDAALAEQSRVGESIPTWTRNGVTYTYDPLEGRAVYVGGVEADAF